MLFPLRKSLTLKVRGKSNKIIVENAEKPVIISECRGNFVVLQPI